MFARERAVADFTLASSPHCLNILYHIIHHTQMSKFKTFIILLRLWDFFSFNLHTRCSKFVILSKYNSSTNMLKLEIGLTKIKSILILYKPIFLLPHSNFFKTHSISHQSFKSTTAHIDFSRLSSANVI